MAVDVLGNLEEWVGSALGVRIIVSAAILSLALLLGRYGAKGIERSARRVSNLRHFDDYQTKAAISRTKPVTLSLKLFALLIAAIALLGVWGLQTAFAGLLAGAGFAGIVIGLAAGDVIGDILAGFMLLYRGPFQVGDWVEIDGTQGIVEDISLADTTVITFDNERVSFPNGMVESGKIKNFTHARKLRFRIPVGVEYGSHLGGAMKALVEVGQAHPHVMKEPKPIAVAVAFGDSSVELELRVWVEPIRNSVLLVRNQLIHDIHDRFRQDGIKIAFPHMQVMQARPWAVEMEAA